MNSLERRLQLGLGLALVILFGLLWLVGNHAIRGLTEEFVVSRLEHDAENVLSALTLDPVRPRVRRHRISEFYSQPFSGHYYIVRTDDGLEFTSRSLWDQGLSLSPVSPGQSRRSIVPGPSGQQLLVLEQGFLKQGRLISLAVAEDLTPLQAQREAFRLYFGLFALGGLLILLVMQGIIVRRTVRRLEPVRQEIQELAQGARDSLSEDVPKEIKPLVSELNHLLTLMTQRLERSRNALGNLTHALKGPLSILTQHLDQSREERKGERQQARAQAERIRQLMERELRRARLAGTGVSGQRFDPHLDMPDLIDVLRKVHREKSLDIQLKVADDMVAFADREDMLELFGNLLDNACKWARGRVRCAMEAGEETRIAVENDGPALSSRELEQLVKRGTRLDETVEGHGLGLAIVKDIVKLYGGSISFDRSPSLGGLRVIIRLPHNEYEIA